MYARKLIRLTSAILVMLFAGIAATEAQAKDATMGNHVFYRTVNVDGINIFYREAGLPHSFCCTDCRHPRECFSPY
jgi:hypothetical protein